MINKNALKAVIFSSCLSIFIQSCGQAPEKSTPANNLKTKQNNNVITASGELESKTTAMIGPPSVSSMWQYQIKQLIPENSKVKKGDVIAAFDNKKLSERLVDKRAELNTAQKELENEKIDEVKKEQKLILDLAEKQMEFEKAKRKFEIVDNSRSDNDRRKAEIDHTIAENDLFLAQKKLSFHNQNTLLNLKLAQAKVDRITNKVNDIQNDIKKLTLTAPIDGMVLYKEKGDGEKPAVGENIFFGQPILEIAVIEKMQLKAQIAEPDSGKIALGQKVKISLDGTQELVVQGTIVTLGRVFRDNSSQDKKRIIDIIIEFDETDINIMRPGMTARIEVQTDQQLQLANINKTSPGSQK
ncbi:MAG: efflux RND transporter periplasmic adaptor subunit [Colwellia sp.]|nr:efflux RND transporter periplasmic adaptor subunit [Colwellia sp.]